VEGFGHQLRDQSDAILAGLKLRNGILR